MSNEKYDVDGCRRLVLAILIVALMDLKRDSNPERQRDAWRFLHSPDITWLCDEWEIDQRLLRRWISQALRDRSQFDVVTMPTDRLWGGRGGPQRRKAWERLTAHKADNIESPDGPERVTNVQT